jgi:hypothetical protein
MAPVGLGGLVTATCGIIGEGCGGVRGAGERGRNGIHILETYCGYLSGRHGTYGRMEWEPVWERPSLATFTGGNAPNRGDFGASASFSRDTIKLLLGYCRNCRNRWTAAWWTAKAAEPQSEAPPRKSSNNSIIPMVYAASDRSRSTGSTAVVGLSPISRQV